MTGKIDAEAQNEHGVVLLNEEGTSAEESLIIEMSRRIESLLLSVRFGVVAVAADVARVAHAEVVVSDIEALCGNEAAMRTLPTST